MGGNLLKSHIKRQKANQESLNEKDFFIKRQQAKLDSKHDEIFQRELSSEEGAFRENEPPEEERGGD